MIKYSLRYSCLITSKTIPKTIGNFNLYMMFETSIDVAYHQYHHYRDGQ